MASVEILEQKVYHNFVGSRNEIRKDSKRVVEDVLLSHISAIDLGSCQAGDEDPFFVADLGEVMRAYNVWKAKLPGVQAHYAVKCNNDEMVVRTLGMMGCNFDCASKNEIDMVVRLGFDASRIVYANPCKTNSFIRHARENGVTLTTADNVQELHKLHVYHPQCRVLIRISTDDESASSRLSNKFGCSVQEGLQVLLPECKRLGLDVAGVAFHIGSGAKDFDSIAKAIADSRVMFDRARDLGFHPKVLDIGGGFEHCSFDQSSSAVKRALEKDFPLDFLEKNGIEIMAEPGRFLVSRAFTLACNVIAKRSIPEHIMEDGLYAGNVGNDPPHPQVSAMLYINDGVYGNLNCILFDHQTPEARVLRSGHDDLPKKEGDHTFSIWGPTCDGLDCISMEMALERDVQVGDWLYFSNVGAYTLVASTNFNGFNGPAHVTYINSEAA